MYGYGSGDQFREEASWEERKKEAGERLDKFTRDQLLACSEEQLRIYQAYLKDKKKAITERKANIELVNNIIDLREEIE